MSAGAIRAGSAFVEIFANDSKFQSALKRVQDKLKATGAAMRQMGTQLAIGGAALGAPIALALRQFTSFDDAIRMTAAVAQATGKDLEALTNRARELGASTSFTATQVATLMGELGRAGFAADQINEMTGAVLDMSRATGTDATLAAGIMAATIRQFGMEASDSVRVADVLTAAANKTFNSVTSLGEAFAYAGPVAAAAGMDLEQTAAILGTLGNVGIQGSEAGTALRRLLTITGAEAEKLKGIFGVSFLDAAGNVRPLVDTLGEVATATNNLASGDRTARFNEAFGLLGITSATVIGRVAADTRALEQTLRQVTGTSADTARQMDAGLGGSLRILMSAVGDVAIEFGKALAPSLQVVSLVAQKVANAVKVLIADFPGVAQAAVTISGALLGMGTALIAGGIAVQVMGKGLAVLRVALYAIPAAATLAGMAVSGIATAGPALVSAADAAGVFGSAMASAGATALVAAGRFAAAFAAAAASDVARLAAPLVSLATEVGGFAAEVAVAVASYARSMAVAVSTTVSAHAAMYASEGAAAVAPFVAMARATVVAVGTYIGSIATAVAATVSGTAAMAAAWIARMMPATTAFVTTAVAGLGTYVASCVSAAATTVASAMTMAAAWLAPMAPIIAIGAAIVAVGTILFNVRGRIAALFSGVGRELSAFADALGRMDVETAWRLLSLNFQIAMAEILSRADKAILLIGDTFAAGGRVIGDALIGAMDRFMGLFGSDIIAMQAAFERLGVYFRAAFDWSFAINGMSAALDAADRKAAQARADAPTAAARRAARIAGRQEGADDRQARSDNAAAKWSATLAGLRDELESVHKGAAAARVQATQQQPTPSNVRGQVMTTPATPEATTADQAESDIGRTVGTFGSAEGLGIGPDLAKRLEDPAKATARNTGTIAAEMGGLRSFLDAIRSRSGDKQPTGAVIDMTKGEANPQPVWSGKAEDLPWWAANAGAEEAKAVKTDGSLTLDAAANELVAFVRGQRAGAAAAGAVPAAGLAVPPAAPGTAIADAPAVAAAPAAAATARAGLDMATEIRSLAAGLTTGMAAVVRAVERHAGLTDAGNKLLAQVVTNTARPGAALS